MKLSVLANALGDCLISLSGDCEIDMLATDSRKQMQNALFFCIEGERFDGHSFAQQAVEHGAIALMVSRELPVSVPQIVVRDGRIGMALIADRFYGHPTHQMRMLGITGTKGKTTTSFLVKAILEHAGMKPGIIGTTGNMIGDKFLKSDLTTPDPVDLQRTLRQMADEGVQAVAMEISAHAIAMHRILGIHFETGCYTNLSQDHLDYFGTMENYFACKKSLFNHTWLDNAAINADEETSGEILADIDVPHITYGICKDADVMARDIEITEEGVHFSMRVLGMHAYPVHLQLTGMFNVYNALAAASICLNLGIAPEKIVEGLASVRAVPGRAEVLETGTPYKVILDYSHSPDALENILKSVREFARGRVIALYGCGGDRDHLKRPMMGEIGGRLADFCILTSDNPRTEDPYAILRSVEEGIRPTGGKYVVIENRREAIRYALTMAQDGDIVVLAGKGHETYQEIMGVKRPFDEKVVVRELLEEMKK